MLGHISCSALYLIQPIQKHNTGIRIFQSLRGGYILLDYIWLDDKSPIFDTNGLLEVDNTTPLDI